MNNYIAGKAPENKDQFNKRYTKPVVDINGVAVRVGDVVRFVENHTDLPIFDNWIERVWLHEHQGLVTNSPLDPRGAIRILSKCKFEIIWPLLGRGNNE